LPSQSIRVGDHVQTRPACWFCPGRGAFDVRRGKLHRHKVRIGASGEEGEPGEERPVVAQSVWHQSSITRESVIRLCMPEKQGGRKGIQGMVNDRRLKAAACEKEATP